MAGDTAFAHNLPADVDGVGLAAVAQGTEAGHDPILPQEGFEDAAGGPPDSIWLRRRRSRSSSSGLGTGVNGERLPL